jgi:signal peptidase I
MTKAFHFIRKEGRLFFTTSLKAPRLFDTVAYNAVVPAFGKTTMVHRLCGTPGDTVEIKGGTLFINGKNADGDLQLRHVYKVSREAAETLEYDESEAYVIPPYSDTLYIPLADRVVKKAQLTGKRYILPAGLRDEAIYRIYHKNWNADHFGPLRVPPHKYFVLGDNRGSAHDSRHFGLIERDKILGIVLWK